MDGEEGEGKWGSRRKLTEAYKEKEEPGGDGKDSSLWIIVWR